MRAGHRCLRCGQPGALAGAGMNPQFASGTRNGRRRAACEPGRPPHLASPSQRGLACLLCRAFVSGQAVRAGELQLICDAWRGAQRAPSQLGLLAAAGQAASGELLALKSEAAEGAAVCTCLFDGCTDPLLACFLPAAAPTPRAAR